MKRWYVIQVYTSFEDVVCADLRSRIKEEGLDELFGEILVPRGEVVSMLSAADTSKEKIFPGYLLIQMEMTAESHRLVKSLARVSRFLGGQSPMALSDREVKRIFSQMEGEIQMSSSKESFAVGSEVHIASGPFAGFVGVVETVDEEHDRLTVMVSIFGRMTPVELGLDQVKK